MSGPPPLGGGESLTVLLGRARAGDAAALDKVFQSTYAELRSLAKGRLAAGPPGCTLEATALVSAACERLLDAQRLDAENRRHFFFILKRAMHDVMVEHARSQAAQKRGGGRRQVPLIEVAADGRTHTFPISDLQQALEELRALDADAAQVVELRFFSGRTIEETAELMGCTFAVVRGHWNYAKAWLHARISGTGGGGGSAKGGGAEGGTGG